MRGAGIWKPCSHPRSSWIPNDVSKALLEGPRALGRAQRNLTTDPRSSRAARGCRSTFRAKQSLPGPNETPRKNNKALPVSSKVKLHRKHFSFSFFFLFFPLPPRNQSDSVTAKKPQINQLSGSFRAAVTLGEPFLRDPSQNWRGGGGPVSTQSPHPPTHPYRNRRRGGQGHWWVYMMVCVPPVRSLESQRVLWLFKADSVR